MIKNFFKNKSLVTLIAGVICLAIVIYFYHYRVNKIIDTIYQDQWVAFVVEII